MPIGKFGGRYSLIVGWNNGCRDKLKIMTKKRDCQPVPFSFLLDILLSHSAPNQAFDVTNYS